MITDQSAFHQNATQIANEMHWLNALVLAAVQSLAPDGPPLPLPQPPAIPDLPLPFNQFMLSLNPSVMDRVALALAMAPSLMPTALDPFKFTVKEKLGATEFGGYAGQVHKGFIPTLETLYFLVSQHQPQIRMALRAIFNNAHPYILEGFFRFEHLHHHEPADTALLLPTPELLALITTGKRSDPEFGPTFPAQKIETNREWQDLVLQDDTMRDIHDILNWIVHERTVMKDWKLESRLAPGFRCLFHGPPGTGKTFTATLLGKATGKEVYRIDLSMVVSKYIGETEKNLKAVFDKAQSKGWILFFDEADALFGKRTDVSDSKDRYANQEVSYLLQRVEQFDGIVLLATNNRDNMDKAFTRRFQVVVNFAMPGPQERYKIWKAGLPEDCPLAPGTDLGAIAERYELAGGSIMNVVRICALRAAVRGIPEIHANDILDGIRTEFKKAGRILN